MIQSQYEALKIQWDALKAAVARVRQQDRGMATIEVAVIAGGLAVLALALVVVVSNALSTHSKSIS